MRFVLIDRFRARLGPIRGPNSALFVRVLAEAKRTTESWGGRLTFVYLPSWQSLSDRRFGDRQRTLAQQLASQVELPFVDILEAMRASEDPLSFFPFGLPGHYNETGYQLVARTMLSASQQR
jgi:hypothetical protein